MLTCILYLLSIVQFTAASTGTLKIEVTGIKEVKGNLMIAIYNKADGFTDKNKAFEGKIVKVTATKMTVEFTGLPLGTYAVSAFHDADSNGELNTGWFGIPTELYGFSNNARGTFGPPTFDDARFEFTSSGQKISFEVK